MLETGFTGQKLTVKVIRRNWVKACSNGRNKRVKIRTQTSTKIADKFSIR